MKKGDKVTFEGMGEQRVGHEPGDLVIVVDELPHKRYATYRSLYGVRD